MQMCMSCGDWFRMNYNCRKCGWSIEGQSQIMKDILKHEKEHEDSV